jgi:hypothetical protein
MKLVLSLPEPWALFKCHWLGELAPGPSSLQLSESVPLSLPFSFLRKLIERLLKSLQPVRLMLRDERRMSVQRQ